MGDAAARASSGAAAAGEAPGDLQAQFTAAVRRHHENLCQRGMNPNEACALALRVAAGQVSLPGQLADIYDALAAAARDGSYSSVCSMIRAFFASPDALHAAFWPCRASPYQQQTQQQTQQQMQQTQRAPEPMEAEAAQQTDGRMAVDSAPAGDGSSGRGRAEQQQAQQSVPQLPAQQQQQQQQEQEPWLQIDHAAVQELHDRLHACHSDAVRDALLDGGQQLLLHIALCAKHGSDNPGFCRQVCGLLANPWLEHMECHELLAGIAGVLVELQQQPTQQPRGRSGSGGALFAQQLRRLLGMWRADDMRRVVRVLQHYITLTLYTQQIITPGIQAATGLLGLVSEANAAGGGALDLAEFYNGAVNEPDFNIKEDFKRWTSAAVPAPFSFCRHGWIYDPASKARILQLDSQLQQLEAFERSVLGAIMGGAGCPYLLLRVRRGRYLLTDTLLQINGAKNNGSLKKPLKVKFVGEEGVDEGGLQKEFFQLLVRECFNPEFGMFTYNEETRLHWFHASSMELDTEYELIGILIGLAIYNGHILEFQFPLVTYKQLLGLPVTLDDLAELQPDIHRSLTKLTRMSDAELAELGLTFQIEADGGFGERQTVDLRPGGAGIAVTAANAGDYAAAYARHLLVTSVARQFGAFQRGFLRLCSGAALRLFRPAELEQLVCGGRVVDLAALEAATRYEDGYTASSVHVRWFWQVVHALDAAQQKRLLFFITGSDRVPIKGLGHLSPPFVITRHGDGDTRLPTAHTCFNHLLLPAYSAEAVLRARLLLAIENAEGFGLL